MKSLITTIFLLATTTSFADSIEDTLAQYATTDVNVTCEVSYKRSGENSLFEIKALETKHVGLLNSLINPTVTQTPEMITVESRYYNGVAMVYLIQTEWDLRVLMTWETDDNGFNASSFCTLPLKIQHECKSGVVF